MNKIIDIKNSQNGMYDFESKWFFINCNENDAEISIQLNDIKVDCEFRTIREKHQSESYEESEKTSTRTLAGRYGNAISSLKRSILQEFVIVATGLFLHYFEIDSTYTTAKSVIKGFFGFSVKREVILSSFSTRGRMANHKSQWFYMEQEEKQILFTVFKAVLDAKKVYESIKNRLDMLASATK